MQLVALRHRIEGYSGRMTSDQRGAVARELALIAEATTLLSRTMYEGREELDERALRRLEGPRG